MDAKIIIYLACKRITLMDFEMLNLSSKQRRLEDEFSILYKPLAKETISRESGIENKHLKEEIF